MAAGLGLSWAALTCGGGAAQMYSNLVQRCFDDCVQSFESKSLTSREEGCVLRCVDKQMKVTSRLSDRFQEHNAAAMAQQQQGGAGAGR